MALNFPTSPTPGQTYTLGSRTWTFDGTAWNLTSSKVGYTGSAGGGGGYTGSVGYTGSAGASVITTDTSAPNSPVDGTLWWNSTEGTLKVYYDDGNSQQWVDASVAAIGYTGSIGYNSSVVGYTGSTGYTGSASTAGGYTGSSGTTLKSITIYEPTSTENITLFFTTVALTLSKVAAVLTGSNSPSINYSIKSGSDRSSASETNVNSTTVTSTTTGTNATIADSTISANSWVWLETSAASGTVSSLTVTLEF